MQVYAFAVCFLCSVINILFMFLAANSILPFFCGLVALMCLGLGIALFVRRKSGG